MSGYGYGACGGMTVAWLVAGEQDTLDAHLKESHSITAFGFESGSYTGLVVSSQR